MHYVDVPLLDANGAKINLYVRGYAMRAEAEQRLRSRLADKTLADGVLLQWVKDNLRDEARQVAAERDAAALIILNSTQQI